MVKMSKHNTVPTLYTLCINVAVSDCVTLCRFCKKEFRVLPDNVLFDFYYKVNKLQTYTEGIEKVVYCNYNLNNIINSLSVICHKYALL